MADIFREVDEEVRREQLKKLWNRYQNFVIAAALLVILGVAGWRGYEWWQTRQAQAAGTAFENAMSLGEAGEHADAQAAFAKIAKEGTAAYRSLARLRGASELAQTDRKSALKAYEDIAGDTSIEPLLRQIANLRAAVILIDQASYPSADKLLEPMAQPGENFRHTARELLAFSAWRSGNSKALKQWIDRIGKDPTTPLAIRQRISVLAALSAEGGQS